MDQILSGLDMVQCYLDDIIVTGLTDEEHLVNLSKMLTRLQEYGLHVNVDKCVFFSDKVTYLGHQIDAKGLHKMPVEIEAAKNAPAPKNVSLLKAFFGLVQYYHKFLPNLLNLLKPLNELLKKQTKWHWGSAQAGAVRDLRNL